MEGTEKQAADRERLDKVQEALSDAGNARRRPNNRPSEHDDQVVRELMIRRIMMALMGVE